MNKIKFQASPELSRFGKAGPPMQHSDTITMDELKELIKREKIRPEQLFSKEQILNDPKLKAKIDALVDAEIKAAADEQNSMIPDDKPGPLTPGEKKQQEEDNEFIPDDDKPGDSDNDLIPD